MEIFIVLTEYNYQQRREEGTSGQHNYPPHQRICEEWDKPIIVHW